MSSETVSADRETSVKKLFSGEESAVRESVVRETNVRETGVREIGVRETDVK